MKSLSISKSSENSHGFSLLEVLVAMSITALVMGMIVEGALSFRGVYSTDMARTKINGNLRSAMDIISMNVRQAGENLLSQFPAVLLTDGASGAADTLILRRSLVPEVLTLCASSSIGATSLAISSASLANAECVAANALQLRNVFEGLRTNNDGSLRIYIYDKSSKQGEFLTYTSSPVSGGQYSLVVNATSRAYTQLTTSIYVLEEYQFALDAADQKLNLIIDGYTDTPRPVAFDVTDFQVLFTMDDGTSETSFTTASIKDWKDIRQIELALSGRGVFKGHVMTSTITARFFPRNILSYEG